MLCLTILQILDIEKVSKSSFLKKYSKKDKKVTHENEKILNRMMGLIKIIVNMSSEKVVEFNPFIIF